MEKPRTLKENLLLILSKVVRMNTMDLAREVGKPYDFVRTTLYELRDAELVKNEHVKRFIPGFSWTLVNEWWITDKGLAWLKERRLL